MSINKVILTGNLTRDPDLRQTPGGMPVLQMGIAVNDRRKNPSTGEWEDYANFVDLTMFGSRAESLSRYVSKGSKLAVEGRLRWSQWEKDGQKRSKLEVIVDEAVLMSQQGGAQAAGQQQRGSYGGGYQSKPQSATQPAEQYPYTAAPLYDDDIPF